LQTFGPESLLGWSLVKVTLLAGLTGPFAVGAPPANQLLKVVLSTTQVGSMSVGIVICAAAGAARRMAIMPIVWSIDGLIFILPFV
jgi:hypothetical protein